MSGTAIEAGTVEGGRYAVFTVEHTARAVAQMWSGLPAALETLLLTPDLTRPVLERYACAMIRAGLCEICVPVLTDR